LGIFDKRSFGNVWAPETNWFVWQLTVAGKKVKINFMRKIVCRVVEICQTLQGKWGSIVSSAE
jgi:hypothetical protein